MLKTCIYESKHFQWHTSTFQNFQGLCFSQTGLVCKAADFCLREHKDVTPKASSTNTRWVIVWETEEIPSTGIPLSNQWEHMKRRSAAN